MRTRRRTGFVLILVIMAIALVGAVTFVLTEGAKTMLFQANMAHLEAVERNLAASGLTWAKRSIESESTEDLDRVVKLSVTDMNIQAGTLQVTVRIVQDTEAEAQVTASCTRGRRTLKHSDTYRVRIPDVK